MLGPSLRMRKNTPPPPGDDSLCTPIITWNSLNPPPHPKQYFPTHRLRFKTPLKHLKSQVIGQEICLNVYTIVGTQRAYFELKYFKIVKMRDAKYSPKMAAEKWRQKFPFLNALYS